MLELVAERVSEVEANATTAKVPAAASALQNRLTKVLKWEQILARLPEGRSVQVWTLLVFRPFIQKISLFHIYFIQNCVGVLPSPSSCYFSSVDWTRTP